MDKLTTALLFGFSLLASITCLTTCIYCIEKKLVLTWVSVPSVMFPWILTGLISLLSHNLLRHYSDLAVAALLQHPYGRGFRRVCRLCFLGVLTYLVEHYEGKLGGIISFNLWGILAAGSALYFPDDEPGLVEGFTVICGTRVVRLGPELRRGVETVVVLEFASYLSGLLFSLSCLCLSRPVGMINIAAAEEVPPGPVLPVRNNAPNTTNFFRVSSAPLVYRRFQLPEEDEIECARLFNSDEELPPHRLPEEEIEWFNSDEVLTPPCVGAAVSGETESLPEPLHETVHSASRRRRRRLRLFPRIFKRGRTPLLC